MADILTATFTGSNTDMNMLGDTMKYVAPIARASGRSLEEMASATAMLGNAGIQGSEAGTALRAIMTGWLNQLPKQIRSLKNSWKLKLNGKAEYFLSG
nr:phage tail tape measure protein [Paenibacillus melissococcoides]